MGKEESAKEVEETSKKLKEAEAAAESEGVVKSELTKDLEAKATELTKSQETIEKLKSFMGDKDKGAEEIKAKIVSLEEEKGKLEAANETLEREKKTAME